MLLHYSIANMSRVTSLGEAFVGTKSYINLTVKIIKQVRAKQFLVADATCYRKIEVSGVVPHKHKKNLREQNYVKIESAEVDHNNGKIILALRTSIFNIREFPVDETKPAKVCIFPFTINKSNELLKNTY